ncbi:MAG: NAD-dependent epimerase [Desulfobacteraceae bacterium]|jgi:UDP-glucuronate 4-epimerase|nr:NAD-dependent epimerase [Desulfobacteraceae bacterium]
MNLKYGNVLVTGAAGFIGFQLSRRLLNDGIKVTGLDNLNPYYDVQLKKDRLDKISSHDNFTFTNLDLADRKGLEDLFDSNDFDVVVNLAAQAGVRYSLTNPHAYVDSNLVGFVNILECCRHHKVKHLVFASSSSVYGANTNMPFSIHHNVDHPVSLYAATKKANELMAHTYSHLYGLCCTGLRFFTVYGPWGRPDMALFLFTKAITEGKPIKVFNHGKMQRDFTYIDDIIEGVVRVMARLPEPNPAWRGDNPDPGTSYAPYKVYNIGNNNPVELLEFIGEIETALGRQAQKEFLDLQPGDVPATYADVDDLMQDVGFKPETSIATGIRRFIEWYKAYYSGPA